MPATEGPFEPVLLNLGHDDDYAVLVNALDAWSTHWMNTPTVSTATPMMTKAPPPAMGKCRIVPGDRRAGAGASRRD